MKRRQFLKNLGVASAAVPVAPVLGDGVMLTSISHPANSFVTPDIVGNAMIHDWQECVGYAAGDIVKDAIGIIYRCKQPSDREREELMQRVFED